MKKLNKDEKFVMREVAKGVAIYIATISVINFLGRSSK